MNNISTKHFVEYKQSFGLNYSMTMDKTILNNTESLDRLGEFALNLLDVCWSHQISAKNFRMYWTYQHIVKLLNVLWTW